MLGSIGIIRSPRTKDPYEAILIMECHVRVLNIAHVELMAGSFYQKISQKNNDTFRRAPNLGK